jgi:hypothetical protein
LAAIQQALAGSADMAARRVAVLGALAAEPGQRVVEVGFVNVATTWGSLFWTGGDEDLTRHIVGTLGAPCSASRPAGRLARHAGDSRLRRRDPAAADDHEPPCPPGDVGARHRPADGGVRSRRR